MGVTAEWDYRFESELSFLYDIVSTCRSRKVGRDQVWQLAPVFGAIPFRSVAIRELEEALAAIQATFPLLYQYGYNRAKKAYSGVADTITKPSYVKRLEVAYPGFMESQHTVLMKNFVREPVSGGLVFNVFHPTDLINKKRPGYVPCLVAGSFVLHESQLHLNAYFRSQSVVEFGIHDLLFLRKWQSNMVQSILSTPSDAFPKRRKISNTAVGSLNLHFGRVIVQNRLARSRRGFLKREHIIDDWLALLEEKIAELSEDSYGFDEYNTGRMGSKLSPIRRTGAAP